MSTRNRHIIQAVSDAETVARLKAIAKAKGVSASELANAFITKALAEEPAPLFNSIAQFEAYLVDEGIVGTPEAAAAATALARAAFAKRGPAR